MNQALDCWINGLLDCCYYRPQNLVPATLLLAQSGGSMTGRQCCTSFINPLIHPSITPFSARA